MATGTRGSGLNFTARLDTAEAKKSVAELKRMMSELQQSFPNVTAASINTEPLTNYQQANNALRTSLLEAQVEAQRLRNEMLSLNASYRQGQISAQQLSAAERQARMERRQLAEASRNARQSQVAANGSYDEANNRLKALGRQIRAAEGGFTSTNPVIRAQIREYNELNDALRRFDVQMGNNHRSIGNTKSAVADLAGNLQSLALGYASQAAMMVVTKGFDVNRQSEAIEASLQYILGTIEEAKEKMRELRENALLWGQDYLTLAESYVKFASAARDANFPLAETDRIFKAITVAGARFNLSTEQISGALLEVQHMISKGTIEYEDLHEQLAEKLPGAFTVAAKAMGKSDKELRKMLETGEVLASDLLPKLATGLEKEYGLKAGESVDSLNAAVGRLSTTFDKALESDGFGKIAKKVIKIAADIIETFDKIFASRSLTEFIMRIGHFRIGADPDGIVGGKQGNRFDRLNAIEDLMISSSATRKNYNPKGASPQFVNAALTKKTLSELETLRKRFQVAASQAKEAVDIYKKGIAAGIIRDGEGEYTLKAVEDNLKTSNTVLAQVTAAYAIVDKRTQKAVADTKKLTDAQLTSYEAIRKRIGELSKLPASATEGSEINRRIEALKARLKGLNKTPAKDTELQARNALQKRIDDLHAESVKKQQSSDEQELNSVKLKYEAMRNEVKAFNNDPKNKQKGYRVDGSRLNADEKVETDAVKDKQDTEKLKESLDKQKQLYADYEAYKTDLGEDEAKKRFAGELDSNTTYLEALKARQKDILIGNPAEKGRYQLQLKYVGEQIAAEEAANKKKDDAIYANAYKAAMTHAQKMADIEADYQRDVKALGENATQEQLDNLKRLRDDRIRTENEANLETKIGWKHLFENFDKMSRKEILEKLRKAKKDIQDDVAAGNTTSSQDADKIKQIDEAISQLDGNASFKNVIDKTNKFFDLFRKNGGSNSETKASSRDMLNGFSDVSGEINSDISKIGEALGAAGIGGEELQNTLKNVMGVVSGAGTLAKGIASGNPVDIVTGSINLLSSAISLFNNKDKKLQKQIDGYKKQLDALQQSYKQLDRAVQNAAGFDIYEKQDEQIANLQAQQAKLIEMRDAEAQKKKKDQGKIDEYNNQIADIPNQIDDINKAISANLIQGTFRELSNSLADALTSAWQAGEDGLAALDKSFDQFIANAIKNSLKLAFFDKDIKSFTEDLTAYAKENGNSVVGFNFDLWRAKFKVDADNFNAGLEASKEYFKTDESSGDSAVKKDIEGIKSTQASALEGLMRGQYDQLKQQTILLTTSNANWDKWMSIGMQKIAYLEAIEINTHNTVEELKITNRSIIDCNTALTEIVKNTKPGPTIRGAGLGI